MGSLLLLVEAFLLLVDEVAPANRYNEGNVQGVAYSLPEGWNNWLRKEYGYHSCKQYFQLQSLILVQV